MPISFPVMPIGRPAIQAKNLIQKPFDVIPAPNMGNPGFRFMADTLGSGRGKIYPRASACNPGVSEGKVFAIASIDRRPNPLKDNALWKELQGTLRMTMSGITRDSAGAILGTCRVMIFRTEDNSFVAETVSDGSGAWSIVLLKGGPFFQVCYKVGAPDLAGTSLNTLVPVQV